MVGLGPDWAQSLIPGAFARTVAWPREDDASKVPRAAAGCAYMVVATPMLKIRKWPSCRRCDLEIRLHSERLKDSGRDVARRARVGRERRRLVPVLSFTPGNRPTRRSADFISSA
jgi:hypothetical protein